jgi:hypothetical protein
LAKIVNLVFMLRTSTPLLGQKQRQNQKRMEGKPWGYYDRSVLAVTVMSLQKALTAIESLTARIAALEKA